MFHWFLDDEKARLICAETGAMFVCKGAGITYYEPGADADGIEFDTDGGRWEELVSQLGAK